MAKKRSATPDHDAHQGRLRWRSRRGMLELELMLQPFVTEHLDGLTAGEATCFARLLEHDDWDLFDWIQGRAAPPDDDLAELVARIRAAAGP
jgi:antitoxin CptB